MDGNLFDAATRSAPARFAAPPAPPHDPLAWYLAGHVGPRPADGWHAGELHQIDIDAATRALVLAPAPAVAPWTTEPSGAFGGLRLPANVAVTGDGRVLLLDRASGRLCWFDPCACAFVPVRCFERGVAPDHGGTLPPNHWLDPCAIALCGDDVYVADRVQARVLHFALDAWTGRAPLRLPAPERARRTLPWRPSGLAVDGRGRVWVSDAANGQVDCFDARGRWLGASVVEPGVSGVAIDCADRMYLTVQTEQALPLALAAAPLILTSDAGSAGYAWQTLGLTGVPDDAAFDLDLVASDQPLTAADLAQLPAEAWSRWLAAVDLAARASALAAGLPLVGLASRYLYLRATPRAGSAAVPAALLRLSGARFVRLDGGVVTLLPAGRADHLDGFAPPPLRLDAAGRLNLHCASGCRAFDLNGAPQPDLQARFDRFERSGSFRTSALDSNIDGCPWHRVELRGALPPGCQVVVRTLTADIALTDAEIALLPPSAWSMRQVATVLSPDRALLNTRAPERECVWDCLISSPPGRYLWLELTFNGDGWSTPCLRAIKVEYPRVSLRRYLPAVFGFDPAGADFTDRFTAIFDTTLRSIEQPLDRLAEFFDPAGAPAEPGRDFLAWLAGWIGVRFTAELPLAQRRRFIKEIARLYCLRGTPEGLRQQLLLLLGFDRAYDERCRAERPQAYCCPPPLNCAPPPPAVGAEPPPLLLEHFKLRRWLYLGQQDGPGRTRLGSDSVLWGQRIVGRSELGGNAQIGATKLDSVPDPLCDPFHVYAHKFSVFVPARVREQPAQARALKRLLALETPAHVQAEIHYVEPRFRVGVQATLGLDSVIARTPCGVPLPGGAATARPLGQGTVLPGRGVHARHGRTALNVGTARVDTTTRLS